MGNPLDGEQELRSAEALAGGTPVVRSDSISELFRETGQDHFNQVRSSGSAPVTQVLIKMHLGAVGTVASKRSRGAVEERLGTVAHATVHPFAFRRLPSPPTRLLNAALKSDVLPENVRERWEEMASELVAPGGDARAFENATSHAAYQAWTKGVFSAEAGAHAGLTPNDAFAHYTDLVYTYIEAEDLLLSDMDPDVFLQGLCDFGIRNPADMRTLAELEQR